MLQHTEMTAYGVLVHYTRVLLHALHDLVFYHVNILTIMVTFVERTDS